MKSLFDNEYFLLQNFADKVTEHFVNGLIDRTSYFKIMHYIEKQKQLFTINLN